MGAQITGNEDGNKLPLTIKGNKLNGIKYELPVASAQVKSAILLAGIYAEGETEVVEPEASRDSYRKDAFLSRSSYRESW